MSVLNRSRVVAAALILSACGGGSSPETTVADVPPQGPVVSLADFRFAPSTITVEGPGPVSIVVQNDGTTDHNFVLMASPMAAESEFSEDAVLASITVNPGARLPFAFDAPPPGSYQVVCSIAGHFDAGMEGTLVVE